METVDSSNFDDYGSNLSTYETIRVSAVNTMASMRDWWSSRTVVQTVLLILVSSTIGHYHGKLSVRKEAAQMSLTIPHLTEMEKQNQAKIQARIIRNRRNELTATAAR